MHTDRVIGVIPARYQSTRFPGKLLKKIGDKTIIRRVWEQSNKAKTLSRIIVATDSEEIREEVLSFGGEVQMTSLSHQSGTDRISEVAENSDAHIIVNVQGDEPLIDPHIIDQAVEPLLSDESILMGTVASKIGSEEELNNPNIVKVIIDKFGFAIYFSRYPLPYQREMPSSDEVQVTRYKHIGLYAYRREYLATFCKLPPSPLEVSEKLEQLRAVENGDKIRVVKVSYDAFGIDTPEDLKRVQSLHIDKTPCR